MKVKDPQVKLRANFCGFIARRGTPMKNASAKKKTSFENRFFFKQKPDTLPEWSEGLAGLF